MSFEGQLHHRRSAQDSEAGLREKLLALISDPQSSVVPFPVPKPHKLRQGPVTQAEADLIPAPRDIRKRNAVRLVVDSKRQAKFSLVLSLGGTVLGAIALGALIGGAIVFDGISVLESSILAEIPQAMPVESDTPDAPKFAAVFVGDAVFATQ